MSNSSSVHGVDDLKKKQSLSMYTNVIVLTLRHFIEHNVCVLRLAMYSF